MMQRVVEAWQAAGTRDPGEEPTFKAGEGSLMGKSWGNTILWSSTSFLGINTKFLLFMKNQNSLNKNKRLGIRFHFYVNKVKQQLVLIQQKP